MKKFAFSLETALRWRGMEHARERAKHQASLAAHARVEERIAQLRRADEERRAELANALSADGSEFEREHAYREYVAMESRRLSHEARRLQQECAKQAARTTEARRAVELIEKIREKEYAAWKAGFEREIQTTAEEAHASRQARETSREKRRAAGPVVS